MCGIPKLCTTWLKNKCATDDAESSPSPTTIGTSYVFLSHSLVAPGTRQVQADQHNAPKTSVKVSSDVSVVNHSLSST